MMSINKLKLSEITEAVTFTPTTDEFKEPLEYIDKIRPIAEKYGICKIIPPSDWKPPFAVDMYNFKFRPRIQRLNELEGKKFRVPIVEGKPIDIYRIYKLVDELGGYESVTKNKRWAYLVKQLNYKDAYTCTTIKTHYENLLYPYILFEAGVTLPTETSRTRADSDLNHENESTKKVSKKKKAKLDEDKIEQIKCLVCKRGDDEAFMLLCDGCDDSYHTFCLYPPLKEIPKGDWRCPVCVAEICKKPTDAYGFAQSKIDYNLTEFGKMANKFKSDYFKKNIADITPEECEIEFWKILSNPDEAIEVEYGADLHTLETGSGFPTKSVRGRYKESYEPYVDSPWNLNNLSLQSKSVLSQMNVDISGMKIPWAYVGMCFSCFCWHVEDHWSYSINYLHMGEIKTWYGVSGLDAEKFEDVMKQKAPELFEKSPDLLHHLVTIMNPTLLQENGVPIYKVNQRAGEFVITFPRAYHAGFNQGFNFAEAVNFCPADWLSLGRAAIENYKLVKRHTVFSHDELVCKVALNKSNLDLNISIAIQNELKFIIDQETKDRKLLLEKGIKNARRLNFEQFTDDERTCDYCKTTCFVSALNCSCKQDCLVCLNHYEHLCDYSTKSGKISQNQSHKLTILYRYEMQELCSMYNKLKQKTDEYFKWCNQVKNLLGLKIQKSDSDSDLIEEDDDIITSKKPHIRTFIKLYQEAKDKQYPVKIFMFNKTKINLFKQLEEELNKGLNVAKQCRNFLNLFKKKETDEQLELEGSDDEIIFVKKTNINKSRPYLDNLKNLLENLNNLKCDIDEADLFRTLVLESVRNETKIKDMVREWNLDKPDEIKSMVDYLNRIEIEFPLTLIEQVKLMNKQADWLEKVTKMDVDKVTIRLLQDLIDEFVNENLLNTFGEDEKKCEKIKKNFIDLQELLSVAQSCDDRARKMLDSSNMGLKYSLEDFEKLLNETKNVPVKMESVSKVCDLVKKARLWIQQASDLLKIEPYLNDLKEMLKQSDELPINLELIPTLQTKVNLFTEWLFKLDTTFLKSDSMKTILDILTPRLDLEHFIHKLQNSLKACVNQSLSPLLSEVANSKYLTKRQREKTSNQSLNMSKLETSFEQSVESTLDFYMNEPNLDQLIEKYKSLQLKEIDFIKQSRRLNSERILLIKNFVQNVIDNPTEPICIKENSLNKIKCTSCTSSILNRLFTASQFNQCKLCLGLYCSVCNNVNLKQSKLKMAESTSYLCPLCDRSKRPKLDLVIDFLVKFEKFQIKSFESNALQMFVNRALNWNERFDKLLNESIEIKKLFEIAESKKINDSSKELDEYYNEKFNQFKKVELQDLHIDGLLLEIDSPKITRLNNLFDKLTNKNTDFYELKLLTDKINELRDQIQFVETTQNTTTINAPTSPGGSLLANSSQIRPIKTPKLEKTKINKIPRIIMETGSVEIETPKAKTSKLEPKAKKQKVKNTENQTTVKSRKREISQIEDTSEEDQCAAIKCDKPTGDNIKWVQCDGNCQKWFHMACVGITKIKRKDKYLCHLCNEAQDNDNSNSSTNSSLNNSSNKPSMSKLPILESTSDRPIGLLDDIKNSLRENLMPNKIPRIETEADNGNINNSIELID